MEKKIKATNTETIVPVTETVTVTKTPGRPVKTDSKRQTKMLEMEIKRQTGGLKKGRPSNPNSARQLRETELAAKRASGELKPGRPKYSDEQKAQATKLRDERKTVEKARIAEAATK